MATRTTVGFMYPGFAAEDDYPLLEKLLGPKIALPVAHTSVGEDAHRVDVLFDLGSVWEGLRIAGRSAPHPGLGALFRHEYSG